MLSVQTEVSVTATKPRMLRKDCSGRSLFATNLRIGMGGAKEQLKWGLPLEREVESGDIDVDGDELQALARTVANQHYQQLLYTEQGAPGRDWLASRGVSLASAKRFQLGWCEGHTLQDACPDPGLKPYWRAALDAAGLLHREAGSSGELLDGRVVFPVHSGETLIGFMGRRVAIHSQSEDKWVHSHKTACWNALVTPPYLASQSNPDRNGRMVVVEGALDALIAHQQGFVNVVATIGNSLSEQQWQVLSECGASSVILARDGDKGGLAGALVTVARYIKEYRHNTHLELLVASLPDGSDPDELVLSDPAKWLDVLDSAIAAVEFYIEAAPKLYQPSGMKAKAQRSALYQAAKVILSAGRDEEQLERDLTRLAAGFGINREVLEIAVARYEGQRSRHREAG